MTVSACDGNKKQVKPATVPPPRGGHVMFYMPKSGKIGLPGGYTYASEEGYSAADYKLRPLELWIYDIVSNKWHFVKSWQLNKKGNAVEDGPTSPRDKSLVVITAENDDIILCGDMVCLVDLLHSQSGNSLTVQVSSLELFIPGLANINQPGGMMYQSLMLLLTNSFCPNYLIISG